MDALFADAKTVLRKAARRIKISHAVFRLHYRLTFIFLVVSSILVTARQYIGEHINCIHDTVGKDEQFDKVINNYCFITPTFSLPYTYKNKVGQETPYTGLGPVKENEDVVYHAYYQWVPFVLFLQALMFYAPHYMWKANMGGGKIKSIVQNLNVFSLNSRSESINMLSEYLVNTMNHHNWWAFKFFFCEVLNFVNVIAQIYLTDAFLGGEFLRYGIEVVNFLDLDPEDRVDPMSRVFPRITKCTFRKYGFSGTVQTLDASCILALNIFNEKIYTFLWFWFVILAIITGLHFLYRIATFFSTTARVSILKYFTGRGAQDDIETVLRKAQIGDWLLLDFLGINMDDKSYKTLLKQLSKKLSYGSTDGVDGRFIEEASTQTFS